MKTILAIIALFSCCGLHAQERGTSCGRELPRGDIHPCPSQAAAATAPGSDNAYIRKIDGWERNGNVFTAPFTVPFAWANRQVLIRLQSASAAYEVRVNGRTVASDANGNVPAEFNVTRATKEGRNTLEIAIKEPSETAVLESWNESPAPAVGTAWVLSQPTMRVRDVLTKTWRSSPDGDYTAEIAVVMKSEALNPRTSRLWYELLTPTGRTAAAGHKDLTLDMRREDTLRFLARIPSDSLWSAERPLRYTLRLKTQHEGRYDEYTEYKLGLRSISTQEGQMYVNDRPVSLRTREVPPQIDPEGIAALRKQGYNTLRLLPGAVSSELYDLCDTIGMYVIAQTPIDTRRSGESRRTGGNPSNDPAWRQAYVERASDTYHTAKRHPSVIAFALARKSANGINLYESYLEMKRLDETRPFIYPDAQNEWNSDRLILE